MARAGIHNRDASGAHGSGPRSLRSLGRNDSEETNARTQPKNDRGGMPRRHAAKATASPTCSWCRPCCGAPSPRWSGAPTSSASTATARNPPPTWRTATRAPRGKPGVCMAQVIGALNLAAGLRDAWLAHSPVIAFTGGRDPATQIPQGLSGGRRRAGVRAGDQVQRHGRRRRALSRHGAAGVPRRHHRHARPGASAVPRQRGPGRSRRSRDGAAGRGAVRARAAVPPGPRRAKRARRARRRCKRPSGR